MSDRGKRTGAGGVLQRVSRRSWCNPHLVSMDAAKATSNAHDWAEVNSKWAPRTTMSWPSGSTMAFADALTIVLSDRRTGAPTDWLRGGSSCAPWTRVPHSRWLGAPCWPQGRSGLGAPPQHCSAAPSPSSVREPERAPCPSESLRSEVNLRAEISRALGTSALRSIGRWRRQHHRSGGRCLRVGSSSAHRPAHAIRAVGKAGSSWPGPDRPRRVAA